MVCEARKAVAFPCFHPGKKKFLFCGAKQVSQRLFFPQEKKASFFPKAFFYCNSCY
jgi:hypothetical protein